MREDRKIERVKEGSRPAPPLDFAAGGVAYTIPEAAERYVVVLQKRVRGLTEQSLNRFLLRARRAAGLRGIVNVLVTSNRELQALNRRFRGQDQPTDVLSFPVPAGSSGNLAGDIAISAEIAAANARALGHSLAEEIKILALHGILHLRGYDHERDSGQMARREGKLRDALHLPAGLIERTASSRRRT